MRNRVFLSVIVAMCLCASGCATKRAVVTPPTEDRVENLSDNFNRLVTGGRITQVRWNEDDSTLQFTRDEKRFEFDLTTQNMRELESEPRRAERGTAGGRSGSGRPRPARGRQYDRIESPDGNWIAVCKDWNVVLERAKPQAAEEDESIDSESTIKVTSKGHRKFRYGAASWVYGEELDQTEAMWWSADSRKLVFYEFDERNVLDHYITGDLTKLHSSLLTEGYPKPGEPNPIANLLIYDLETQKTIRVQEPRSDEEWYTYGVRFSPEREDGARDLLFFRTNRRQNLLHLMAADVETGETRVILTEKQDTWQDNSPSIRFLNDGDRFIWETEKSGWKQYELRTLEGSLIVELTHGEYPVQSIVHVNEDYMVMYYTAFSDAIPILLQLHRVDLDGTNQRRLTREPLHHTITMSPDSEWFIAEMQAANVPPTTALYDNQGNRIATLAESDTSKFEQMNMTMPELFTFKADDGVTDLFGVLYKPSNFDPKRKYPLVIDVYGGPHSQAIRGRFSPGRIDCEHGLLIAQIDNRGTINRGKAFEAATYLRLGDVDIKDQAEGVRYLTQRPYIDAKRVGIMGHSYGGYMAALAVLKFPDMFYAAAAGGTVTDWRQYDTIYTERYMRTPLENPDGYDNGSCMKYVENLTGKLLLLHGVVDDNVHSNNAWQLIDALHKANKPFEMMFFPNAGHSLGGRANTIRWEFLREHLLN